MNASVQSQYVRRKNCEKITDKHTTSRRGFSQRTLFWGCFSGYGGIGPLVHIPKTMNSENYINTLNENLLPHMQTTFGNRRCIFQHDNAPCHKSEQTKHFIQVKNIRTVEWPPYSPDLNPIENMWSVLKKKVHKEPLPSKAVLIESVLRNWSDAELNSICLKLADSMVDRITECISSKGGYTHY